LEENQTRGCPLLARVKASGVRSPDFSPAAMENSSRGEPDEARAKAGTHLLRKITYYQRLAAIRLTSLALDETAFGPPFLHFFSS
jgi:hypothetical protein